MNRRLRTSNSPLFGKRAWGGWIGGWLVAGLAARVIQAMVFFDTGDPEKNTAPPDGELAESGWQWQGKWGNFQGTPIGPRHFITAAHIGGAPGGIFSLAGVDYVAVAQFADPETDLKIWEIAGTFASFAPLPEVPTEAGAELVIFGRGVVRGRELFAETGQGAELRGWLWGGWDKRLRWGRNTVEALLDARGRVGGTPARYLAATFDADGGPDESTLATGDSGGAGFVREEGVWRLAAIHYSVDGPYNTNSTGAGFRASVFDERGLFRQEQGVWVAVEPSELPQPGAFYSTLIEPRLAWIREILALPPTPLLLEAAEVTGPFVAVAGATVDRTAREIRTAAPGATRYYKLISGASFSLSEPRREADAWLVLPYR